MYSQNLETLRFSQAIVYEFEPESFPSSHQKPSSCEQFFHLISQYEDILNAYLYAQNECLPVLQTRSVVPEQFLTMICDLHARIAKTLLKASDAEAGQYTDRPIYRWQFGEETQLGFIYYFSGTHVCKNDKSFAKFLSKKYGVSQEDGLAFIRLLGRLKQDNTIELTTIQRNIWERTNEKYRLGSLVIGKLFIAYHSDTIFTPVEKESIKKIVKCCIPPEDVPAAMNAYAIKTLQAFQSCDPKNLDAVTEFLATSFYELVETHPFQNANGRVATCIMNLFLHCFNLPSIVLRQPGDRNDPQSLYSIAFRNIDTSRESLRLLIKKRIMDERHLPFSDPHEKKMIELRVTLLETMRRIQALDANYDLWSIVDNAPMADDFALQYARQEDREVASMEHAVRDALKIESSLIEHYLPLIKEKLLECSGQAGWVVSTKKSALLKVEGEEQALHIVNLLQTRHIGQSVEMKPTKQANMFAVLVNGIDMGQFTSEIQAEKETNETKEQGEETPSFGTRS